MNTATTTQTSEIQGLPYRRILPRFYRALLGLTRRHGLFTLARLHDRFLGGMQRVRIPGGGSLIIPGDSHYFGFLSGVHEPHVAELIETSVAAGDVCIDVGANIGYFAMMMAMAAGPKGRVIAFEPVPDTFGFLKLNAALASLQSCHLEVHQAAVSSHAGELVIERQQHSTLNQVREAQPSEQGERVPCIALSEYLETAAIMNPVALLKIDVEGHELSVIEGAMAAFKAGRIKRMIIEVTPGEEAEKIGRLLASCKVETKCWIDHQWKAVGVSQLSSRTDVLVDFNF